MATAHVDDNLGCEEPHAPSYAQQYLECWLGMLEIRETSFGFVGMLPPQDFNFSFAAAQKVLMCEIELVPAAPTTHVERRSALLMEDAKWSSQIWGLASVADGARPCRPCASGRSDCEGHCAAAGEY